MSEGETVAMILFEAVWEGRREEKVDGLAVAERDELTRLRRENKQLRLERDILSRAAAWFARDQALKGIDGAIPSGSSNS